MLRQAPAVRLPSGPAPQQTRSATNDRAMLGQLVSAIGRMATSFGDGHSPDAGKSRPAPRGPSPTRRSRSVSRPRRTVD